MKTPWHRHDQIGGWPLVESGARAEGDLVSFDATSRVWKFRAKLTAIAGHGASEHTNRSRRVWYPATAWGLDGGTRVTRGTTPDLYDAIQFADAATQGATLIVVPPTDIVTGSVDIGIVLAGSGAAAANAVIQTNAVAVTAAGGNALAASANNLSTVAMLATTDFMTVKTFTGLTADNVASTSLVRVQVERLGADGSDAYTGNVFFLGAYISYTADG